MKTVSYSLLIVLTGILLSGCSLLFQQAEEREVTTNNNSANENIVKNDTKPEKTVIVEEGSLKKEDQESILKSEVGETMNKDSKVDDVSEGKTDAAQNIQARASYSGTVLAGTNTPLLDYNKKDYETALANEDIVVLYFYASWCPICRYEVSRGLYPAFNELALENTVGFRVNYNDKDTDSDERALARQFGVAYQHTKVILKNGNRVLKDPATWSKNDYISKITTLKSN